MDGQVALVTGGSTGIGLAVARRWIAEGGVVALVARTEAKLLEAVTALGNDRAAAFPLDVGDLRALEKLPALVFGRFGRIDLVVNNAGVHHRGPLLELPPAQLAEMILVNLTAPIVLTRAVAPLLRPGSAIVNVASLAGMVPVFQAAGYSASKAGLRAFTRAAAEELAPAGIHVGAVSPGPVDTGFFGDASRVTPMTFSQPMSSPEEVADAVLRCARERRPEIALPWASGKLATLGYLSPWLSRTLRPLLEKRGLRNKQRWLERHGL